MVSVLGLECRRPGFESRCGQRNLVMELVNIYLVFSCSFVEIMRLCVVSVCINFVTALLVNLALVYIAA